MKTATARRPLGEYTVGTFPFYSDYAKRLVKSHLKHLRHPVRLAIWFDKDDPKDIWLLEVLQGFPPHDEPNKLFTMAFQSTEAFPLAANGRMRLVLTSAEELGDALKHRYSIVERVRQAFRRTHAAEVVFRERGEPMLRLLRHLKRGN